MAKKPEEIELSQGNNLYVLGVVWHQPNGKVTHVGGCCTYGNVTYKNAHQMWDMLKKPAAQAILAEANAKMAEFLQTEGKAKNLIEELDG